MKPLQGIPRVALSWLLVAQVLVIVPHLQYLPIWVAPLWLICAWWRIQIFRMRATYPGRLIRLLMVCAAALGVWFSKGSLIGLEAGSLLLIIAFVIKLLELKTLRDAWVLILLGFVAVLVSYLFDDSLLAATFSLLPILSLLAALLGLQQSRFAANPAATLRLALLLVLQALPLMLLLFVVFPRVNPLWSMPSPNGNALTGLSDSMSPGDMVKLGRSAELAFRVSFAGQPPERTQLYWRALTLEAFDGQRWSQVTQVPNAALPSWQKRGEPLTYQVIMEPSNRPWLFVLDVAQIDASEARMLSDFRLERRIPVQQSFLYNATSWPQALLEADDSRRARRFNLQLPEGNPQTRAWAATLRTQYPQPAALVQAVLQHFNQQPFAYTLRPPATGEQRIDGFLFNTQAGFCEHYAGAMTFVLRAAGIPARVVTGYQGGELNTAGKYLLVHQFDAHAWVEYWQAGVGWTRVDPTGAVSPERIEQGLEVAMREEGSFLDGQLLSPLSFGVLNDLRLAWDRVNYNWQRWVLGYQGQQQGELLERWLGRLSLLQMFFALLGGLALVLAITALCLLKPWRRDADWQVRSFQRFEALLTPFDLRREPAEGHRAFVQRAILALPAQAALIRAYSQAFEAQRYAGAKADAAALRRHLQQLRRALPWRWRKALGR